MLLASSASLWRACLSCLSLQSSYDLAQGCLLSAPGAWRFLPLVSDICRGMKGFKTT